MKNFKVFAVLTAVSLVAVMLFVACGKSGGGSKRDQLVFMMWGDSEERAAVDIFLADFKRTYTNIKPPKVVHLDSFSYWDKFQVMISAGNPPDVFYMGNEEIQAYLKQDILMDLTPLIERDKEEIEIEDFYKKPMDAFNINGKQYGIAKDFATLVLYYNIDLFEKAGVNLPNNDWDWKDLHNAATRLTVREGSSIKRYGFQVETWASWLPAWVWANGGRYMNREDEKWLLGAEPYLSKNAEAYQFLADMMTKDKIAPDVSTRKQLGGLGAFTSQKIAMTAYGRWAVLQYKRIKDFRWGIAELPKSPSTGERASTLFTAAYCISKRTDFKEEAWTLVKFLTGKDGQKKVAEAGLAIPTRKSIATSKHFLDSEEVNRAQWALDNYIDHEANLRALKYAKTPPSHKNWLDIRDKLDQWFQPVFIGTKQAKEVMESRQAEFQAILEK